MKRGFKSSNIDPCVFISEHIICLVYVDDCILIAKDKRRINSLVKSLMNGKENFDLTDDRVLKNYIGVEFVNTSNSANHRRVGSS